jgi:hypothetical protein
MFIAQPPTIKGSMGTKPNNHINQNIKHIRLVHYIMKVVIIVILLTSEGKYMQSSYGCPLDVNASRT